MGLRFRKGLPRGGIGYVGLLIGAGSIGFAFFGPDSTCIIVPALAVPLCLWLGLGLRFDGEDGEVADQVMMEGRRRNDWLEVKAPLVTEFRLSSAVIFLGLIGLGVALMRKYDVH